MPVDGVGSGVILALAALLWLAYLVPSWLRRREYLSTERNALRLQKTLRIMAETAEVPAEIRAETTARSAAQHERLLRTQRQRDAAIAGAREAAVARAAARRLAEVQPAIAADVALASSASRRLRRSRAVTSLVLLAALVATGFGVGLFLTGGAWLLLGSGVLVAVGSFAMLGRLAAVSRTRAELARGLVARRPVTEPVEAVVREVVAGTPWTPVPLPKPLYLSRPIAERTVQTSLTAAADLRQAAADAERRIREAEQAPEVAPLRRPAAATPSRFASMGFVDSTQAAKTDLDAVLARRRSAG